MPARPPPESAPTRPATSSGLPKKSGARCSPVSALLPAHSHNFPQWTCGCRSACSHSSKKEIRFRLRFWAVLVFRIEFGRLGDGLFGHACREFLLRLKLFILAHAPNHPPASSFFSRIHPSRIGVFPRPPRQDFGLSLFPIAQTWRARFGPAPPPAGQTP